MTCCGQANVLATHATSATPQTLVNRWRHELDAETIKTTERHCGWLMRRFGYEVGG
jgi:hypothetical protein